LKKARIVISYLLFHIFLGFNKRFLKGSTSNFMLVEMTKVYYDFDADLSILEGKTVSVIGYGNQGRAWSLNLRESHIRVVVGNIEDQYKKRAEKDGFKVYDIPEAVNRGDIVCLLIPDEIHSEVYENYVDKYLQKGDVLVFAHGFSVLYGEVKPPKYVDVILVAPRMIGVGVRTLFLKGTGAPALVGVRQNSTGKAIETMLAISKALGFTRTGVIESSFEEETHLDLFSEQVIWPTILGTFVKGYEVLNEAGYSSEAIMLEMFTSGEIIEALKQVVKIGLMKQLKLHSRTSQYGQLSQLNRFADEQYVQKIKDRLEDIRNGEFAKEWSSEQKTGYPLFNKLNKEALKHPINEAQARTNKMINIDYDIF
jgi:ketol-acid reductoisomerase